MAPEESTTTQTVAPDCDSDNLSDLEDDPTLSALHASRLSELKAAAFRQAHSTSSSPYASLQIYKSEKSAMHTIAAAPLAVLLFTHPDFPLCTAMSEHLKRIAGLHAQLSAGDEGIDNVSWLSIDAEQAPFLTEKLRIRVLPCMIGYKKGEEAGRLVGFEGLRSAQKGSTWREVATVLKGWGLLGKGEFTGEGDEDSDLDEDDDEDDADGSNHQGSWVGRQKSNSRASIRGTGTGERLGHEDDDWD